MWRGRKGEAMISRRLSSSSTTNRPLRYRVLCLPIPDSQFPVPRTSITYDIPNKFKIAQELIKSEHEKLALVYTDHDSNESMAKILKTGILSKISKKSSTSSSVQVSVLGINRLKVIDPPDNLSFEQGIDNYPLYIEVEDEDTTQFFPDSNNYKNILKKAAQKLKKITDPVSTEMVQLDHIIDHIDSLDSLTCADLLFAAFAKYFKKEKCIDITQETDVRLRMNKIIDFLKQYEMIREEYEDYLKKLRSTDEPAHVYYQQQLVQDLQTLADSSEGSASDASRFQLRMLQKKVPAHVDKVFRRELSRLKQTESHHTEHQIIRNYLDWISQLPWGVHTTDKLDPEAAIKVLDEDHYGMDDVKKRILEFIAVGSLKGSVNGKILCFAGPPGVGKTSIASSIAKALGRKFERISMGGVDDVAVIKGHRRTYIGAAPGSLIAALKRCGSSNPVILIDEIDKISRTDRGDPSAALLEALDPSQNSAYNDLFVDFGVDLSKVLFLATANYPWMIPGPLLDRMEVIELASYVPLQKLEIAKRYLLPKSLVACGLKSEHVRFEDFALEKLISHYCREPGVRSLERHIERALRKVALKVRLGEVKETLVISPENLQDYVGHPPYHDRNAYGDFYPVGLVNRFTSSGSISHVEAIVLKKNSKKGELKVTGNAETVVQEISKVSWAFCKKFLLEKGHREEASFFDTALVHLHILGGSKKKNAYEGFSIVVSLLSLALNKPIPRDFVFCGEVTLNGKILRTRELREKYIGALRHGIKKIIVSEECTVEYDEFPKEIMGDIDIKFARKFSDVFEEIFPDVKTDKSVETTKVSEAVSQS